MARKYETDQDFHSKNSPIKFGWRWAEMGLYRQHMTKVPKGQFAVLLGGRFMDGNKVDPNSEVALGVEMGIWDYNQVISIDGSADVVKSNKAAERLGVQLIHGDFAKVINAISVNTPIAIVSADFMATFPSLGDDVAQIMMALNKSNQPHHALLFVNGNTLLRNSAKFDARKYDPMEGLSLSKSFIHASTDLNPTFPSIWTSLKFYHSDAQHVTAKAPMKSILFEKTTNPNFGKRLYGMSRHQRTRLGIGNKTKSTTITTPATGKYAKLSPQQRAWVTIRAKQEAK